MTKEEAVQYQRRWELVKQARLQEVRRMSTAEKIKDLEVLFEFGEKLGWSVRPTSEGWEYWRRLKELSNV